MHCSYRVQIAVTKKKPQCSDCIKKKEEYNLHDFTFLCDLEQTGQGHSMKKQRSKRGYQPHSLCYNLTSGRTCSMRFSMAGCMSFIPLIIKWMPKVMICILGNNYTKCELNLNNTQKMQLPSSMQYAGDGYEQQAGARQTLVVNSCTDKLYNSKVC